MLRKAFDGEVYYWYDDGKRDRRPPIQKEKTTVSTKSDTYHDLIVAVQVRFPGAIRGEVKPEQLDELAARLVNEANLPGKPSVLWMKAVETGDE